MNTSNSYWLTRRWIGGLAGLFVFLSLAVNGVDGSSEMAQAEWQQIHNQFVQSGQVTEIASKDAQMNDYFGVDIAVDGDTLVVGAFGEAGGEGDPYYNAGAAYVFEKDADGPGNWGQVAKLMPSDPGNFDEFGQVVAISGDTIAVGAPYENGGPGHPLPDAGAVYVFERNQGGANNWGEVKKIVAGDPDTEDDFGRTLSLSGDTLVASSPGEDGGEGDPMSYAGAVYVFERNQGGANNWGQVKKIMASDAQSGDGFGQTVAVDGDTLVAGSPAENGGLGDPILWAGAAYVFERNLGGTNNWGEVTKLMSSDADEMDRLGTAAAIDGDTIVVSAPFEKGGPGDPLFVAGASYVFERNLGGPDNWGEVTKLSASDPDEGDFFGSHVAILGDTIISGTPYESGGPNDPILRAGAAYVYSRNESGPGAWGEVIKLMAEDAQSEDVFGSGTAVNGSGLIFIGASRGDADGPPAVVNSGVVYIFEVTEEASLSLYLPAVLKMDEDRLGVPDFRAGPLSDASR